LATGFLAEDAMNGAPGQDSQQRERIVDAALALAAQRGWEPLRLHDLAATLGIGLDDIRRHFREKDELIDAWFDRADAAMLVLADSGALAGLSPRQRLVQLTMVWLDALEPRRAVTRQMIAAKAEPGHLHIQVPAVMRISRTVQWLREAAGLEDKGLRRALGETALTGIYLAVFSRWLAEHRPGSPHTRALLDSLLGGAERLLQVTPFLTAPATRRAD
jgi:AcrR family transcriptional regulator